MRRSIFIVVALLAAIPPSLFAQRIAPPFRRFAPPRFSGAFRDGDRHAVLYPLAFSDPFYAEALYSSGYPVASQPPVILLQAPPPASAVPDRVPPPAEPLMIELRGNRYVRVSGEGNSTAEMIEGRMIEGNTIEGEMIDPVHREPARVSAVRPEATQPPPTTVLIFRDGHREEVSEYTIAEGVLYARANYYTNGTWTRNVALSLLNLEETLSANRLRGLQFRLPAARNEIIVGP